MSHPTRANRRSRRRAAASALAAIALPALAAAAPLHAQQRFTVDDFLTITPVREFVWSADGKDVYYVAMSAETGTSEIFRVPVGGGRPTQLSRKFVPPRNTTPVSDRSEPKEGLVLSADGSRLFYTSARYFQNIDDIFSIPTSGGDAVQHTFNDAIIETSPAPSPDGRTLAYFSRTARGTKIHLLDLGKARAWPRLFDAGSEEERDPVWSPDGKTMAFTRSGDIWIRPVAGGAARRLVAAGSGSVSGPVWSPDGSRIAVTSRASGFSQIGVVDVATGALTAVTYAAAEHEGPAWSPDGRTLAFTMSDGIGISNQLVVAPADGSAEPKALTSGRGIRRSAQYSPDGRSIAFIETTSNRPADVWLVPASGGQPRRVTSSEGRVPSARLSVAEEVTYPSVDNLPLRALLFKPPGFDPSKKYPVVVALHGHPTQWNHTMNPLWQWVIQQGYVLVAPNPRGSIGMGQGFHDLHVGDYGGTEFEDIMGVVGYLKTLPFADTSRMATWGGSGGGYMSFVIATQAPTTFKAQVIRAPVSSWKWLAMERYVSPARFATATREPQRAREEFGGAYTDIPERYDERSPLNYVENVKVPQLLMQGMRDGSVPPNESRRWVARMRELGKGSLIDYVEYPNEDHSLLRYQATIRDQMVRIPAFLAEHLGAPSAASR